MAVNLCTGDSGDSMYPREGQQQQQLAIINTTDRRMEMKVVAKGCRKLGTICSISFTDYKMWYVVLEGCLSWQSIISSLTDIWPGSSFQYPNRAHTIRTIVHVWHLTWLGLACG